VTASMTKWRAAATWPGAVSTTLAIPASDRTAWVQRPSLGSVWRRGGGGLR
jgi:hypothetical protein